MPGSWVQKNGKKARRKNPSPRDLGTWQYPDTLLGSEGPLGGGQACRGQGKRGWGSDTWSSGNCGLATGSGIGMSDSVPGCTT